MKTLHISDISELQGVAEEIIALLVDRRVENKASVLALKGDLGAGKTAFTKILGRVLGVDTEIISPTFVIMKRYEIEQTEQKTSPFTTLVHIDAYRIEDIDEMRPIRLEEILQEQETLVCIEWAERIVSLLPSHTVYMDIKNGDTHESRIITLS